MKGSEYIFDRIVITAVGFVVGGGVVVVTALWVVPWIIRGLEALFPRLLPPLGGVMVGLAVVIVVALLMKRAMGYYLVLHEQWAIRKGGIDDL